MLRSEDLLSRVPGVFRCVSSPSHRVRQPPWSAALSGWFAVTSEMSERPLCLPHTARTPSCVHGRRRQVTPQKDTNDEPRGPGPFREAGVGITVYF